MEQRPRAMNRAKLVLPPFLLQAPDTHPPAKSRHHQSCHSEDIVPISKLAEAEKSTPSVEKHQSEAPPAKKPSSDHQEGSSYSRSMTWVPEIMLDDRPLTASGSAVNLEVGAALSTAVFLPENMNRMTELYEYDALMMQHSVLVQYSF